ncbi:MAG TPA: MgtC/SapB family protein [Candidatus Limnocylindrales bacterium]|nr:MgtC/SapB family protein [Candidatus Limnocylindrales bacterium]
MASFDLGLQIGLALRLLLAAVLGAVVGFEREIHEHPAGMRTHLLVSLGSAAFTVLSIYGFEPAAGSPESTDTSRVAAQIVTGIGFLGAGAIIKYGTSVRGLTTAASLWATAGIGMAVGAGWWFVGIVVTAIVVLSLWPLRSIVRRVRGEGPLQVRIRLHTTQLQTLGEITRTLNREHVELSDINSQRLGKNRYEIELFLRIPANLEQATLLASLAELPDVEILETDAGAE